MALPSQLVYNDLDGEEVRHVLEERFRRLLADVSYLQRHLTLPRVKMTLQVHFDLWADQVAPERHTIQDQVEIRSERAVSSTTADYSVLLSDTVNAAPGGLPPDKIREDHGIPVPTPVRGQIATEDRRPQPKLDGSRLQMDNGVIIDRTGKAPERARSTIVVQDFGRAGLAEGQMNRPTVVRGTRDGGPVERPHFPPAE